MSDRPKYLDASPEELAAWKAVPMTAAYFEWVESEIERGKEIVCDLVYGQEIDKARTRAGMVAALRAVLQSTDRPQSVAESIPDEDFHDPAEGKR